MYTEEPFLGLGIVMGVVILLASSVLTYIVWLKTKGAPTVSGPADSDLKTDSKSAQAKSDEPVGIEKNKLGAALSNTRSGFVAKLKSIFSSNNEYSIISEEIEEALYTADIGPKTVQLLLETVKDSINPNASLDEKLQVLREKVLALLKKPLPENWNQLAELETLKILPGQPTVFLVVGVNGAGKTTTIGKLTSLYAKTGKKVLVAAGDTFRAAAGEQLKVWAERAGSGAGQVEIFDPEGITDPGAVAYQAVEMAKANGFDLVIVDTAGRLHTQKNLMEELKKVKRVMSKVIADAPHETILVLDANSGQNALHQAEEFHQALSVSGVVLTKLDGSAKGGVAIGVSYEVGLPIRFIGIGEGLEDLRKFDPEEFSAALLQ